MPLSPVENELQSLLKLQKRQIDLLKQGLRIERVCGSQLDVLMIDASCSRFKLARDFLTSAEKLMRQRPPSYRSSVSRAYYSMYHAARTVSYVFNSGDDHQDHKDLHRGIPDDFPECDRWKNDLKEARLRRNEADYDPYPILELEFEAASRVQLRLARDFFRISEDYLKSKGCPL